MFLIKNKIRLCRWWPVWCDRCRHEVLRAGVPSNGVRPHIGPPVPTRQNDCTQRHQARKLAGNLAVKDLLQSPSLFFKPLLFFRWLSSTSLKVARPGNLWNLVISDWLSWCQNPSTPSAEHRLTSHRKFWPKPDMVWRYKCTTQEVISLFYGHLAH